MPMADPALEGLQRLAPAEALVCTLVGASAAGLRMGLETAWDAQAALRNGAMDIERIARLVASMQAARAFWVPARVLALTARVAIPAELLSRAPDDLRQRRLERIAERRLFRHPTSAPLAEWSFRSAWPLLASTSAVEYGRRLPSALARAAWELPGAWGEIGAGGMAGAIRQAGRGARVWVAEKR
jgi:hypothetical protein